MGYITHISTIEREIHDWLQDIADAVYINNAPQAVPTPQSSYIVVSVGSSLQLNTPYKSGSCYIYVFVKNKESGVQDSLEIDRITNAVLGKLPLVTPHVQLIAPRMNYGTRSGAYTCTIIRLRMVMPE